MNEGILKLQYEILGVSFAEMASGEEYSPEFLKGIAKQQEWKRKFEPLSLTEEDSDVFLEDSKKRLQIFETSKELYLAGKYSILEASVIQKAILSAERDDISVNELKTLSSMLTSLKGPPKSSAALEDGAPLVVVKDYRGS